MGFLSGLFSSGKGVTEVADPYGSVRNDLNSWLTGDKGIGKSGPKYTGEQVAEMSDQEKQSLGKLSDYSGYNTANDQTFQNAKAEINKTLTNQYDPTTSPYYQAVKAQAAKNLAETKKSIASEAGGGGRFYSGARLKAQGNADTDVTNSLNTMLGKMSEDERQRRLDAATTAQKMSQYESQIPLQQAQALQTLGALPRTIQQAKDQAALEDWLRSEYEYPMQVANIAAGVQQAPMYQQNKAGLGYQALSGIAQSAPQLAMAEMMMCWVAAELFGGWNNQKTNEARYFIMYHSPMWFRNFYAKNGKQIAKYIHNKPMLKAMLRPMFEMFAHIGRQKISEVRHGWNIA